MKLFCPILGLHVHTQDDWRGRKLGEYFTANFYIVGQSVLYSGPSGTADLPSVKSVLKLSAEVARKVAGGTGSYIQIEDYAELRKATIEARRYFITQMISRDRLMALIFCNLSPMLPVLCQNWYTIQHLEEKRLCRSGLQGSQYAGSQVVQRA